ncbi:MAG TPA: ATP-binding protein [Candidatus Coprenecus stercoravium]|uniref:ATP-binding protein n=1 Tax=Candidatus Coprenecus stercoravium TaxID=2840735 RepID=A0A9D2GMU0_9BACT|nr:ATP-binding protein [Candidatus Coprenecus stercoravium]
MKYPIGVHSFEQIRKDGYAYVDKTDLIYRLTHEGNIYFLSRPRRFGKSLLVSTLKNYFLGRKELFEGLAISSLEKEWLEYPVFHIDFNGSNFTAPGTLDAEIEGSVSQWESKYGRSEEFTDAGRRFAYVLKKAHERTGRRCVVLIDEYDKPMLDVRNTDCKINVGQDCRSLENWTREVLRGLYSVFKAADADLQFVLLTGVTKFAQESVFSGFNQHQDISMDTQYEALCGITQEELEKYFAEPIDAMAASYGESREEMLSRLKRHYDGYHFSKTMTDVYNPFSLLNAFAKLDIRDYWFASGTPTYLIRLLSHSDENLDELTGKYYDPSQFVDYKADVEKPLPMIYQSGYLTIKDYRQSRNTFLLDIPNNEVKKGFVSLIASDYFKNRSNDVSSWIQDLLDAFEDGETDRIRDLFTSFLADIPYTVRRREDERERERYFQYTFYLILRMVSVYLTCVEKPQSQGRVDCIVETPKYVYIFEFKLDGTADEALAQIEEKGYARPYAADSRTVHCIGVSFSSETGTVEEWKCKLLTSVK